MGGRFLVAVALVSGTIGTASAHDANGAQQIAKGDYVAAERVILREQRMFPRDTDLLINLATVYARTGRVEAARRTYALAAAQPDERLDVTGDVSGDTAVASSRDLATRGLRSLDRQVATLR